MAADTWDAWEVEHIETSLAELLRARRALDAAIATGLRELDDRGSTEVRHGLKVGTWFARNTRSATSTCTRDLRTGEALDRFPLFGRALRRGELGEDHALALHRACNTRNRHALQLMEEPLLSFALGHTYREFERELTRVANLLDEDGPEPDCRDRDTVSRSRGSDGSLHLRVTLTGHHAATVDHALRAETDRQYRIAKEEQGAAGVPLPTAAVLRARALSHLVRCGLATDPTTTGPPRTEATVAITVDATTTEAVTRMSADGEPLDAATAATLTCDAHTHPVLLRTDGSVLWAGRSVRFATPAQRRAVSARDRGCVFPGCGADAHWCDAHHVVPWEEGGTTDPDNLVLLCRSHHGLAHSRSWHLEVHRPPGSDAAQFWWTGPDGVRRPAHHAPA